MNAQRAGQRANRAAGDAADPKSRNLEISKSQYCSCCGNLLSICIVGDSRRAEFIAARTGLTQWGSIADYPNIEEAVAAIASGQTAPDVIVMAQAFPGQFSAEAIDRLRRQAPLARIFGLMGSWCEGEMRTGSPWPAVVRTYWHQWPARARRLLGRLASGRSGPWTLPLTDTEEERLLADACELAPKACEADSRPNDARRSVAGVVAISSGEAETAQWIAASLRAFGYATVWHPHGAMSCIQGATAAIFDATNLVEAECSRLREFVRTVYPAPVVVLLGFPRIEDEARARLAGAAAVLSKPISLNDLRWTVESVGRDSEGARGRG